MIGSDTAIMIKTKLFVIVILFTMSVDAHCGVSQQDQDKSTALVNSAIKLANGSAEEMELLHQAVACNPDNWIAHNDLGSAYYTNEDFANATSEYDKSDKLHPTKESAWLLGMCAYRESNSPKAIEGYKKFLAYVLTDNLAANKEKNFLNNFLGHYFLGQAYFQNDQKHEAIAEYKSSIEFIPAIQSINKKMHISGTEGKTFGPVYHDLGLAYMGLKDFESARDALKIATGYADTTNTELCYGLCLYYTDDHIAGRLCWRKVLRMGNPDDSDKAQEFLDTMK
jgi:tetratricopeptide (TPR) repeat protein